MLYKTRGGFTSIHLMLVVTAFAATAAITVYAAAHLRQQPKAAVITKDQQDKETLLRVDLSNLRNAEYKFMTDTCFWPLTLSDLTARSASELSTPYTVLDGQGKPQKIKSSCFHGPYLKAIPIDPVSQIAFDYSLTPGSIAITTSSASGSGSDGVPYSQW